MNSTNRNEDDLQEENSLYDELFYEAGQLCIEMGKASSSMLQRRFNIGFNRSARIIDQLEEFGLIGPLTGDKPKVPSKRFYDDMEYVLSYFITEK